jgi:hypothetical protein
MIPNIIACASAAACSNLFGELQPIEGWDRHDISATLVERRTILARSTRGVVF